LTCQANQVIVFIVGKKRLTTAPRGAVFLLGDQIVKHIIVPDDDYRSGFERFCEKYDIPVMDRPYLASVFENGGWDEARDVWREMQLENE